MADNVQIYKNERNIYLQCDITEESISKVNYYIFEILNSDQKEEDEKKDFIREPINLYINSRGGEMSPMWSLIDLIECSKSPIHTYCTGYAMSAGFLIFITGKKRFITNHARVMCHQFFCGGYEEYQNGKEYFENMDLEWNNFVEHITKYTKISKEQLIDMKNRKFDWYIYKDEAIELNIADEVITSF